MCVFFPNTVLELWFHFVYFVFSILCWHMQKYDKNKAYWRILLQYWWIIFKNIIYNIAYKVAFLSYIGILSLRKMLQRKNDDLVMSTRGDRGTNQHGACWNLGILHSCIWASVMGWFSLMYYSSLLFVCEWRGDLKTSSRVINKSVFLAPESFFSINR